MPRTPHPQTNTSKRSYMKQATRFVAEKALKEHSISWAYDYYQKFNIYTYIWAWYTGKEQGIDSLLFHE